VKITILARDKETGETRIWSGESIGKSPAEAVKDLLSLPPDMEIEDDDFYKEN